MPFLTERTNSLTGHYIKSLMNYPNKTNKCYTFDEYLILSRYFSTQLDPKKCISHIQHKSSTKMKLILHLYNIQNSSTHFKTKMIHNMHLCNICTNPPPKELHILKMKLHLFKTITDWFENVLLFNLIVHKN